MSERAILPLPPGTSPESYEARLNFRVSREIGDLKTKYDGVRMGRLAAYNSAVSIPTGNTWAQGDIVRNSNPSELGGAGSKYVLLGWICTVSGTPGTWVEMRTLTGN